MPELPKIPETPVDPVARSIAKPSAFSSPGTVSTPKMSKGMRFRALRVKRGKGRPRKKARDPRDVQFY